MQVRFCGWWYSCACAHSLLRANQSGVLCHVPERCPSLVFVRTSRESHRRVGLKPRASRLPRQGANASLCHSRELPRVRDTYGILDIRASAVLLVALPSTDCSPNTPPSRVLLCHLLARRHIQKAVENASSGLRTETGLGHTRPHAQALGWRHLQFQEQTSTLPHRALLPTNRAALRVRARAREREPAALTLSVHAFQSS
eukprot:COSAG03_NODE_486_length_7531_cov_49.515608_4_plen_200_part_00